MPFIHKFVSKEGEKELLRFKYKGGDNSLMYKCFYSPTAEALVKYCFPEWLAYYLNFLIINSFIDLI